MFKCTLKNKDWKKGHDAALAGKPGHAPKGVDGLSWMSGYLEGKAEKNKNLKKIKAHLPVII
jgi:hypothetical protein